MSAEPGVQRLRSLDALRGFDMFWIVGGSGLLAAVAASVDSVVLDWMVGQTRHVPWHGFRLWDLVFPLFLFIAGVAMPFSLTRRMRAGHSRRTLALSVVRRGLTLVFLGWVYNGLLRFDFENLRYASVLGRIGLAYLGAGLIVLRCGPRSQAVWAAGLLLAYWAALSWIPVPGTGAGVLEPGKTLPDYLDRLLLPGRLHRGNSDPEGILSTVPAVSTALLGALTGNYLRGAVSARKALVLLAAGLLGCGVGWVWGFVFPVNKSLWSSSFVLVTAGLSLSALSFFYLVIDVWGFTRWATFFVVIGTNAITIYMLNAFVSFDAIARFVLARGGDRLHPTLVEASGVLLRWLLLFALYRRRIFLRV